MKGQNKYKDYNKYLVVVGCKLREKGQFRGAFCETLDEVNQEALWLITQGYPVNEIYVFPLQKCLIRNFAISFSEPGLVDQAVKTNE